jgi:hypothetical protein
MLVAQLGHDFAGLLIIELVIIVLAGSLGSLLLTLFGLLHDNFVTHSLLHDDVVEDVPEECVLHLN